MTQHFLPADIPDAAAAYIESMPPGRVELFSLAPLDRTGVACWNAIFLNSDGTRFHGVTPHGVGYGTTDAEAIIGTTGELAEAVHAAGAIARFPRRIGSYAALAAELGVRGIADPLTLTLPAGSPVDHDTVLEWVPAQRWPSGESVLVPTEIAGCSVGDFTPGYQPFITPITNGLGAGPTLDFAIGHGICELLQRDGNGTGFRALDRGIALDLGDGPADPRTRALLDRLAALNIDVIPKFASDEFGVAGVYCVGGERDASAPFPIMLTAAGEAASVDREQALRKALFEFAAARVRKMFSHAPLSQIAHIAPPGYLERFRSYHSLDGEESRALREMMAWCRSDAPTLRGYMADTVLSRRATKRFDELPTWDGPLSGTPLVTELARRFAAAGMEVLFVDFSPSGARDVHVVKAIVPGLEVETMSYHRIGERGVRKLMERNSPLVGLGAPPPGALPVRLPAGAAERLGGAAWLDVAAVDRIVGRLYPLYREPEVHSAPIAIEKRA
ncbi:YcaO-like family protein [Acidisphaera sp. L21]|uniref:YcaO-like family protein n=1 Tax=Acidisphaera sp. L21 TaxID=1641851 RepID=UPI00131D11AE|nr:YcaO-like family protein [Acidisphaera sp. L21]